MFLQYEINMTSIQKIFKHHNHHNPQKQDILKYKLKYTNNYNN